jgi:hypothetical protein
MRRPMLAALVSFAVILAPVSVSPISRGAMPTFDLRAPDGMRVGSVDVLGREPWILVYAIPGCGPCDELLTSLGRLRARGLFQRTVLVIGAPQEDARAYVLQRVPAKLRGVRWYADEQAEAWQALRLGGTPMLVGIRDGRVEWTLSGTMSDPESLDGLLSSWLGDAAAR